MLTLISLFIVSCTSDTYWSTPPATGSEAQIILRLSTPGSFSNSKSTRNLTFAQENQINDVYVLVFNNATPNALIDIKKAGPLSSDGTFTINLPASKGVAENQTSRLVVLANVENILNNTIGTDHTSQLIRDSYDNVMAAIYGTISGKMYASNDDRTGIPMWGETDQITILPGNTNERVSLMRAVARIDVGVGAPTVTQGSTTDGDNFTWDGLDKNSNPIPFELTEVYVISPNKSYAVVPNENLLSGRNPTLINTDKFTLKESETLFKFSGADDITYHTPGQGGWTSRSIYIPEADVKMTSGTLGDDDHANRMAVIVGGKYNGSGTTTYYRLDFSHNGKEIINVMRNTLYRVNIRSVAGEGYDDVEQAYTSRAMNMEVDVLNWDEEELDDLVFDGTHYFSISRREVSFHYAGQKETVMIKTNVTDFSMWINGTNQIQANDLNIREYKNENFEYTLTPLGGGSIKLDIKNLHDNVSPSPVSTPEKTDKWTFVSSRLRFENFMVRLPSRHLEWDISNTPDVNSYYMWGNNTVNQQNNSWNANGAMIWPGTNPCEARGDRWRLPTADEFDGLLAQSRVNGTIRGFHIAGTGTAAGHCLGRNANATCAGRDTPNSGVLFFPYAGGRA
jgi:hypothetical protein